MEIEIFAPIYQRFSKQQESLALLASDWYWEKLGFADLLDRNMKLMSNIKQSNFKGFSVKVEIITPYYHSNWISKQPVSLPLLLSDWYCQKLGLTDLPGHYEKSTSDMNLVLNFFERTEGANRDYSSLFSVIFQATSEFAFPFVRLILVKVGLTVVVRYDFEGNFKGFRVQIEIIAVNFDWISKQQLNLP